MGDYDRLKQLMKRAECGDTITIGFLGGSITQGSLASSDEKTYAYQAFKWWEQQFPQAQFQYVNAGIGGTSSQYGVARANRDLLIYRPDFVVIDFSVNDDCEREDFFAETFEGVLRKVYDSDSKPAVLVLNNVYYDTGINMQQKHNEIAEYYGILHVSVKDTIFREIRNGKYKKEMLTPDNLHPNDLGHELVANEICKELQRIKDAEEVASEEDELKEPVTENKYENSRILNITNWIPQMKGFKVDADEKHGHLDLYKNGWIGSKKGDAVCFEVQASSIAVQYRKSICRPAPVARLILDDDITTPIILDANFNEDWGDCLYLETILHHGELEKHKVSIEIIEEGKKDKDFYLVSLIVS